MRNGSCAKGVRFRQKIGEKPQNGKENFRITVNCNIKCHHDILDT